VGERENFGDQGVCCFIKNAKAKYADPKSRVYNEKAKFLVKEFKLQVIPIGK